MFAEVKRKNKSKKTSVVRAATTSAVSMSPLYIEACSVVYVFQRIITSNMPLSGGDTTKNRQRPFMHVDTSAAQSHMSVFL